MTQAFNRQLEATQTAIADGTPLIWTPEHYKWLALPSRQRVYTPAAEEFAQHSWRGLDIPARTGDQTYRFSASSVQGAHGQDFSCHRATLFHFASMPKLPPTPQQQDNMDEGSWLHLKYQMEGISAGYIASAETWDFDPDLRYGMKDDGILYEDSLLELKFVNAKKYAAILNGDRRYNQSPGPLPAHVLQVTGGMMLKGKPVASLVYVNKEDSTFIEYRIPYVQDNFNVLLTLLDDLNGWVDLGELPAILEGCQNGTSWLSRNCEYRDICPHQQDLIL